MNGIHFIRGGGRMGLPIAGLLSETSRGNRSGLHTEYKQTESFAEVLNRTLGGLLLNLHRNRP
jgi:hypothetical protein